MTYDTKHLPKGTKCKYHHMCVDLRISVLKICQRVVFLLAIPDQFWPEVFR